MLTIFTTVAPFAGKRRAIQDNAIRSWLALEPAPEVLLFGAEEEGAREAAERFGISVYPVERNRWGTPLLRSCFEQAEALAHYDVRCYLNADIIVLQDFVGALRETMARFERFLLSARRWDLDLAGRAPDSFDGLETECRARGELHKVTGVDMFCYRGVKWTGIPDLAVGRSAWDNWLVWKALAQGAQFVDATGRATLVHQEHEVHRLDPERQPERQFNQALYRQSAGARWCGFNVAHWKLTGGGFEPTHYGKSRRKREKR